MADPRAAAAAKAKLQAMLAEWSKTRPPYVKKKPDDLEALVKKLPPVPNWHAPPLILAILENNPDAVKTLIAETPEDERIKFLNRVEEHKYNMYGNTPLAIAESVKKQLLIAKTTPLAIAESVEEEENKKIIDMLVKNEEIIDMLIKAGAKPAGAEQEGARRRRGRSRRARRNRRRTHRR